MGRRGRPALVGAVVSELQRGSAYNASRSDAVCGRTTQHPLKSWAGSPAWQESLDWLDSPEHGSLAQSGLLRWLGSTLAGSPAWLGPLHWPCSSRADFLGYPGPFDLLGCPTP